MAGLLDLLADESFQRFLAGQANSKEAKRWSDWLHNDDENRQRYHEALQHWKAAQFRSAATPNIENEWKVLQDKLGLNSELSRAVGTRNQRIGTRPNRTSWARFGALAVVSLLLVMAVKFFSFTDLKDEREKQDFQLLTTEFGQRVILTFPDDSRVILNANSSLRYPAVWRADVTSVCELQGEAYFDVSPRQDAQEPFIIKTIDGTVSVFGTEFAVYERGGGTRVVVTEGRVGISVIDTSAITSGPVRNLSLQPGQLLLFQKGDRSLSPNEVAVEPYTTWWKQELVLVETPVEVLIRRLEETYGVDVEVADQSLLKRTLSGSIENQSLMVVTDAIAEVLKVTVQRNGQQITFGAPSSNK